MGRSGQTTPNGIKKWVNTDKPQLDDFNGVINEVDTALSNKAEKASPALTGTPTAPTAARTVDSTQLATTEYVRRETQYAPFSVGDKTTLNSEVGNFIARTTSTVEAGNPTYAVILGLTSSAISGNYHAQIGLPTVTGSKALQIRTGADASAYSAWRTCWSDSVTNTPIADNIYDLGSATLRMRNIYAGTATIQTSDKRHKKDISPLDKIKDFFMTLNPVSFRFNDGASGRTHHGLIAQEVEAALKENELSDMDFAGLIKSPDEEKEGEYIYGLRYSEFIPMLIKMVQEQQKRIEVLEAK